MESVSNKRISLLSTTFKDNSKANIFYTAKQFLIKSGRESKIFSPNIFVMS